MSRYSFFEETLKKCEIYLENCKISNEIVLQVSSDFLKDSLVDKKHSASILLHTGSVCYDAVAFVMCVLANIIMGENDAVEYATSLEIGTKVSYRKKLWQYEGLYSGTDTILQGKYVLKGVSGEVFYVTEKALSELVPYHGAAKNLRGKGVRIDKSKRIDFLENVLKLERNEIIAVPRTSTVVYMDNTELDYLLKNILISFPKEDRKYEILDLVTVTFYTLNNEIRKRGNSSKNEPAIKVTNSMERARELIVAGEENAVIGFAAFRSESYRKNALDFEELLRRRKLRYSWLITPLEKNTWIESQIDEESKKIDTIAFTSRVLRTLNPIYNDNNRIAVTLAKETYNVANRICHGEVVESNIVWSDYKKIKNKIAFIMNHNMGNDVAVQFCIWSYSMLKFFNNAFFTMEEYENFQRAGAYSCLIDDIEEQKQKIALFANLIKEKAEDILNYIELLYQENYTSNAKRDRIRRYISQKRYTKVLFVIPNIRFEGLLRNYLENNIWYKLPYYSIVTESKLKTMNIASYDAVVFTALMNFDKVNPIDLINAKETVVFLYDAQRRLYRKLAREHAEYVKKLDFKNPYTGREILDELDEVTEEDFVEEKQVEEENEQDATLQEAFMKVFLQTERYHSREYFNNHHYNDGGLDAHRYGQFVTGEQIIFTKGYIAYVFDHVEGIVIEKKVDELEAGDKLVFTVNDDKTKDIVDELLMEVCDKNPEIANAYELVTYWKEEFRAIKRQKNWSYVDISRRFSVLGCSMTPQTVRQWLDIQSHIVGPKERDRFKYIGKVMGNTEIENDYLKYAEATSTIRSIRIKILKLIENAVVADISGAQYDGDDMFRDIIDRIREIAVVKQLDKIETIDTFKIQFGRANRPIEH